MVVAKSVIDALDAKIKESEKELERLKRATELLPKVEADLQSLRRTRAMFAGQEVSSERHSVGEPLTPQNKFQQHSLGGLALEIIREASRPIHVDEILPKVRVKRVQASRASLVSTLIRYTQDGKLRKTAPNTFGLPG